MHPVLHSSCSAPVPYVSGLTALEIDTSVRAGFPSPAEDFQAERIDVLKHIIVHPQATFTLRVRGVRGDLEAALECVLWGAGGQRERYFNWLRRRESGHGGAARRHSDGALLAYKRAIHAEVKGEYGWPRMHKELLARVLAPIQN